MSLFQQIKQTKDKVHYLLNKYPHLRDDDFKLIATYWKFEAGEKAYKKLAIHFLEALANGTFTHPESIRRCRAKVQKDHPELRGTNYQERQEEGVKVAVEISNI